MPHSVSWAAGPTPDFISRAGEWMAPAETIVSRARIVSIEPSARRTKAPTAVCPSNWILVTSASARILRFGRRRTAGVR
jgi:hypothetical protein